jgi:hypothetical protein
MYGFPTDFDCKTFIGRNLDMVSYTSTQVHLNFSGGIFVTINGGFSHTAHGNERSLKMPVFYPEFIHLCDKAVIDAYVVDNKNLHIIFENQERICIYDDPNYESYEINQDGKRMII